MSSLVFLDIKLYWSQTATGVYCAVFCKIICSCQTERARDSVCVCVRPSKFLFFTQGLLVQL